MSNDKKNKSVELYFCTDGHEASNRFLKAMCEEDKHPVIDFTAGCKYAEESGDDGRAALINRWCAVAMEVRELLTTSAEVWPKVSEGTGVVIVCREMDVSNK